ncbi:MAG: hypothetical protein ACOYL8_03935 [Patescibacteria group bacterium]
MEETKNIITKLKAINTDFKKNLHDLLMERDKKVKKILKEKDEKEIKKINSSLKY